MAPKYCPTLISTVTDGVMDEVKQWQSRPLDAVYPVCTRLLSVPKFVTLAAFVPKRLKPSIHTIVQLCIVHMVRNSLNYVGWRNKRKKVAADLRLIYGATTIDEVEQTLPAFEDK